MATDQYSKTVTAESWAEKLKNILKPEAIYGVGTNFVWIDEVAEVEQAKKYNFEVIESTDEALLIKDLGPWDKYHTITNAAELIVDELLGTVKDRRLEYIDSNGERGRLLIRSGKFAGFAPPGKTKEELFLEENKGEWF